MADGRVTITDVAREAGVSIATVSRVIAGKGSVSPELAARVQAAVQHLGYRPSPIARGLATGETCMVGVLVPQLGSPYFQELIKAIGVRARQDGYNMLVLESDDHPEDEAELAASLYAHVDGVILCAPRMPEDHLRHLATDRPRLVCANRLPADGRPIGIAYDIYASMVQLCRLLHELGHRRLAYLGGRPDSWASTERRRAVLDAADLGLDPVIVDAGPMFEHGYAAVDAALEHEPTALLATNDFTAVGALTRLKELGRRVPADVSVTGFDDILMSSFASPPLTTVRIPRFALGDRLWTIMRVLIAGEPVPSYPPLPASELVVRASTGPAPGHTA